MPSRRRGRAPPLPEGLTSDIKYIVGRRHVISGDGPTRRYRLGYRIGGGDILFVVRPGSLLELWQVAKACAEYGTIMILQAANTGLTGGSTPFGKYDRPVVVISTTRIDNVLPIENGREAICLAGSTLTELEDSITPFGRLPHSVIGSSCIGASVVGGVCNNSGGALVRHGPAFTRRSLFARVTAHGELELVNRLGRDLGNDPETILRALDRGETGKENKHVDADDLPMPDYQDQLRKCGSSPARYNADPTRLQDASGCAGKLIVMAVRVDTHPAPELEQTFLVGTSSADRLARLRRVLLEELHPLPSVCEYMHRSASELAAVYGRDICMMLALFGPRAMPHLLGLQKRIDSAGKWLGLKNHVSAHLSQWLSKIGRHPLPANIRTFFESFDHVLLVKTDDAGIANLREMLETACAHPDIEFLADMEFLALTKKEADAAFRLRFASAGATVRMRDLRENGSELAALDIALPRNATDWFIDLPQELERQVQARAIYGHFLCHVFHLDHVLHPGFSRDAFEHEVKQFVEARGGRMPAEHNFGHLYKAPDHVVEFYRSLDPTNSLNPGIGKTSRNEHWR